ncbi:MAG: DUF2461 domain-containing protein [Bacteroidota bacterium]
MIEQDTLAFLGELAENNHKDWFEENRSRYKRARENFISFIDRLIPEIQQFDPEVTDQEARNCIFRINRDVRFSKDKSPYKINLAAVIAKGGKKSGYASYYLHLKPGECMMGGGNYMPPSADLKKIRHHIEMEGEVLRELIDDDSFKEYFGELRGEKLKTAPKGYPKDHPDIDLLQHKGFYVMRSFSDEEVLDEELIDQTLETFQAITPLNHFLNAALDG